MARRLHRAPDLDRMKSYALIATASYHGQVVQERFALRSAVEIGHAEPMILPVPRGAPYIARVEPARGGKAVVLDGRGQQYLLSETEHLEVDVGPITLRLELAPQFALKRTEPFSWKLSTGWLAMLLMMTIGAEWYDLVQSRRCEIFGVTPELSVALGCVNAQSDPHGVDFTAEYLARLLREDYAGSEDGTLRRQERPDADREPNSFYLPAGNEGPITNMGGAEDVASEPVRAPRSEDDVQPEVADSLPAPEDQPLVAPEDVGSQVPEDLPPVDDPDVGEGVAEAVDEEQEEVIVPAEEKEGWGVQDWYDQSDKEMDNLEIEVTIRIARERLKIDPDDGAALSLLSYYQYLAEDYEAATKTYDHYIELFPDDAAGYNNKALVYKRRGNYEQEEALYRVALNLEPLDVTAMNNLAVNLSHQKRFDEALEVMEKLDILDPGDPYADLHRAKIYAEMGDNAKALTLLEKALTGMKALDTLHHIEFRQDIRVDPSFAALRETARFRAILLRYYGDDSPLQE